MGHDRQVPQQQAAEAQIRHLAGWVDIIDTP